MKIGEIVQEVNQYIYLVKILGIHAHNDTENAVSNSLTAILAGVRQVQGTINGLGERCGNANLMSVIPTLSLKEEFYSRIFKLILIEKKLKKLQNCSRLIR